MWQAIEHGRHCSAWLPGESLRRSATDEVLLQWPCSQRKENVVEARKRMAVIKSMPDEELKKLLHGRDIDTTSLYGEDRDRLEVMVVVTDKSRQQQTVNIVRVSCQTCNSGGSCDNSNCKASRVISRAAPGRDFIDQT